MHKLYARGVRVGSLLVLLLILQNPFIKQKKVTTRKIFTSLQFPASSSDFTLVSLDLDSYKELSSALQEVLHGEANEQSRYGNFFYHLIICAFSSFP